MLKKSTRLRRDLVKDLLDSRRFFHSEHFLLRAAASPLGPRLGVSVSKKVSKSAVARNRLRRRTYAALTDVVPTLGKSLYLISAKPSAASLSPEALRQELAELLKRG